MVTYKFKTWDERLDILEQDLRPLGYFRGSQSCKVVKGREFFTREFTKERNQATPKIDIVFSITPEDRYKIDGRLSYDGDPNDLRELINEFNNRNGKTFDLVDKVKKSGVAT